ncbi:hypothetical protein [Streptococcus gallolyticus]|uniref:hypothetical protein n=1 Tax=Streptococcus gallolyticus TaxID=315405 RepID=UPI003D6DE568
MDKFTLWGSTDGFTDFIVQNTLLQNEIVEKKYLPESDASKPKQFHKLPTHIKNIQYLDSPDLIIELNREPILSIEISREAGTGHNVFQRFARIAAAVENNVPCIYIYPEAAMIYRQGQGAKWDSINPLIFYAIERLSRIYPKAPALLYYYPSYYRDDRNSPKVTAANKGLKIQPSKDVPIVDREMEDMFDCINDIIKYHVSKKSTPITTEKSISDRISFMQQEYYAKGGVHNPKLSPISSTIEVPSKSVVDFISRVKEGMPQGAGFNYFDNTIWASRKRTIIYKVNAKFRADPYPGCLAALDYMLTRRGQTYEDRDFNLVIAWGDVHFDEDTGVLDIVAAKNQTITDLFELVKRNDIKQDILTKSYEEIDFEQLPRYFMQLRFGSTFSKPKHVRVYSYFSDAILFPDGALWREG